MAASCPRAKSGESSRELIKNLPLPLSTRARKRWILAKTSIQAKKKTTKRQPTAARRVFAGKEHDGSYCHFGRDALPKQVIGLLTHTLGRALAMRQKLVQAPPRGPITSGGAGDDSTQGAAYAAASQIATCIHIHAFCSLWGRTTLSPPAPRMWWISPVARHAGVDRDNGQQEKKGTAKKSVFGQILVP